MVKLYQTENERVYEKVKALLNTDEEIKRTKNGKPYIDGFEFSITHTGDTALIAISDKPVGIDAEKLAKRKYDSVLKRFPERELTEIYDTNRFLRHWVVKEAYIKMLGGTLAHDLKRIEYFGGDLFEKGKKLGCNIHCSSSGGLIYAICAQREIPQNIEIVKI